MPGINKVSGADVAVRVGSGVVSVKVEQAIIIVAVVVAAHIQSACAGVRIHRPQKTSSECVDNPVRIIT